MQADVVHRAMLYRTQQQTPNKATVAITTGCERGSFAARADQGVVRDLAGRGRDVYPCPWRTSTLPRAVVTDHNSF